MNELLIPLLTALLGGDPSPVRGEQQALTASDATPGAEYGMALAQEGSRAVVGAYFHDQFLGAAYVLERQGNAWAEVARLAPADLEPIDFFGAVVDIEGPWVAVAAPKDDDPNIDAGAVYLYRRQDSGYELRQKIVRADGAFRDQFGGALALAGDALLIAARLDDHDGVDRGSLFCYRWQAGQFRLESTLTPPMPQDLANFGWTLDRDGDLAVISAPGEDARAGAVYLLRDGAAGWQIEQRLTANTRQPEAFFGASVCLRDDLLVIGAPFADSRGTATGQVHVFRRQSGQWIEEAVLAPEDLFDFEQLGWSVAHDGDLLLLGSPRHDDLCGSQDLLCDAGKVYGYRRLAGEWTLTQELYPATRERGQQFGRTVALDRRGFLIGASHDDRAAHDAGALLAYPRTSLTLSLEPTTLRRGDPVQISACGGQPLTAGLVFLTAVEGIALAPLPTPVIPRFDAAGECMVVWSFSTCVAQYAPAQTLKNLC